MTNNANFWTDWYTNCSQLSHDLRSHLRSRKMRLMRKIVGAIYMKYVLKLNLFNLVLIGIPFHPRKCPLLQNHVIICLEMSTISRKFRHTWKHDDVVVIKSMFRNCHVCRPWEKQTSDKSSWNVPLEDTSYSPQWAVDAKSAWSAPGAWKRRRPKNQLTYYARQQLSHE